jgi:hypothetical protein
MLKICIYTVDGTVEVREVCDAQQVIGLHIIGYFPVPGVVPDTPQNRELMQTIDRRIASRNPRLKA